MATVTQQGAKDYLTNDLPQELLDHIIESLDLSSQLKLRLVFNPVSYEARVVPAIRPILNTLYVSPSNVSLCHFRNICSSAFFQTHVTLVIFIQTVTGSWDFAAQRVPLDNEATEAGADFDLASLSRNITPTERYRRRVSGYLKKDLTSSEAFNSLALYRGLLNEHKNLVASSPDIVVDILRVGLSKLHKLEGAMISELIGRDGLNASAWLYDNESAQFRESRGLHTMGEDLAQTIACRMLHSRMEERGTRAFLEALEQADVSLQKFAIGEDHEWSVDEMIEASMVEFSMARLSKVLSSIKILTISSVDALDDQRESHTVLWQPVAESLPSLEELALFIWAPEGVEICGVYEHFLNFGSYPNLRRLMLIGPSGYPAIIDLRMLQPFLARHKASLETIALGNTLLVDGWNYDKTCEAMRSFLEAVSVDIVGLKRFDMCIYRIHGHVEDLCQTSSDPKKPECNGKCEFYELSCQAFLHRDDLKSLADDLGVHTEDGYWHFGKYVMKKLAAQSN